MTGRCGFAINAMFRNNLPHRMERTQHGTCNSNSASRPRRQWRKPSDQCSLELGTELERSQPDTCVPDVRALALSRAAVIVGRALRFSSEFALA